MAAVSLFLGWAFQSHSDTALLDWGPTLRTSLNCLLKTLSSDTPVLGLQLQQLSTGGHGQSITVTLLTSACAPHTSGFQPLLGASGLNHGGAEVGGQEEGNSGSWLASALPGLRRSETSLAGSQVPVSLPSLRSLPLSRAGAPVVLHIHLPPVTLLRCQVVPMFLGTFPNLSVGALALLCRHFRLSLVNSRWLGLVFLLL